MIRRALELEAGHGVHLWCVDLDRMGKRETEAAVTVPEAEAAARRGPLAAARFLAGRAALRTVLAGYLRQDPAAIQLLAGPSGKPALAHGPAFNLSHSESVALIAVDSEREVGVDVECLRRVPEAADIVARHFTPRERARYASAAAAVQPETFLELWTQKEAYLKALGVGMDDASLLEDPDPRHWLVHRLAGPAGCAAALAVAAGPARGRA